MTDVNTAPDGWQRPELEDNAESVLQERYYLKDENGKATEDASGLFYRVATAIARPEGIQGWISLQDSSGNVLTDSSGLTRQEIPNKWTEEFYDLMASRRFLPNSPCLMNAGKKQKGWNQMAACFVLPIEDSLISIADTHRAALLIHQSGGGTGFNFSRIRPKGSYVRGSSGVASGPVSFMSMIDHSCGIVKQGGTRRGANMGILNVSHLDIFDFITCKSEDGEIENFNISVGLTDEFMEAVEQDLDWYLDKADGTFKVVKARTLWDKIIHGAWLNGEPGAIFLDELDRDNPVKHIGNIDTTNPCGEIGLLPYEACVLGSINISEYLLDEFHGSIDYDKLEEDIYTTIRFLDNMIDASEFPLDEIDEIVKRGNRRLGLGIMGWADLLLKMKIRYGSEESIELSKFVASFVNHKATMASEQLGRERGFFGNCENSSLLTNRRNVEVTAIAPTGTISMIAGCSSGIEPIFAFKFVKSVMENVETGEKHNLEYVHPEYAKLNPNEVTPGWFVDASNVAPREHVLMQAAWQKYIGNAVSKTINLPSHATIDDVAEAYILAWKTGCKGITVYRDGSRSGQVLTEVKSSDTAEPVEPVESIEVEVNGVVHSIEAPDDGYVPFKRPEVAESRTTKINNGCGSNYISVSFDENGKPFEIFSTLGKTGGCGSAQNESIGRMASLALRNGATIEDVIRHLRGIQCNRPVGFGDNRVLSCGDGISQALERIMGKRPSTVIPVSDLQESGQHEPLPFDANRLDTDKSCDTVDFKPMGCCPSCEGSNLNHESGCVTCMECGWSECG